LKTYNVKQYSPSDYDSWNTFVANAKNATFLFHRDFMEYHHTIFKDFSLLICDEKENLKAILPANRVGDVLFSHQGLTYGGLVLHQDSKLSDCISIFHEILIFLQQQNIRTLFLKQLPNIYVNYPSDEVEYICFLLNARLVRRDSLSVIEMSKKYLLSKDRNSGIQRGIDFNLVCREENKFDSFWNEILIPNLKKKHNTLPVHSLEEITYLKSKFPNNIRQFNIYKEDNIIAGTTIFETNHVAHSQYISAGDSKNKYGSLDFLHHNLILHYFKDKKYFDFGISNENQGKTINQGLLYWKEGFGARTIVQNFYEVETKNYSLLQTVLR